MLHPMRVSLQFLAISLIQRGVQREMLGRKGCLGGAAVAHVVLLTAGHGLAGKHHCELRVAAAAAAPCLGRVSPSRGKEAWLHAPDSHTSQGMRQVQQWPPQKTHPFLLVPPADPAKRYTMADVLAHPWCQLQPEMLAFNELQVANSLGRPPRREVGASLLPRWS